MIVNKKENKMAVKKRENTFEILNKVDVTQFTKKKGKYNYLSWCFAVKELLRVCPEATWEVHTFSCSGVEQPYMKTDVGYFVQVTVDVDGIKRTQVHPVLDNRNEPIKSQNAFQINTSIQRCLAKAIALHGLGLYIFAGEDLPEADPLSKAQEEELKALADKIEDDSMRKGVYQAMENGTVNAHNFDKCVEQCNKIIKENK